MTRMDLSVIIPVYNNEAFLPDTIGSVFMQTKPPAELVIADDGSTDRSAEIAELFAPNATSFPVRVMRLPHRGVCATRNTLFREVKSKWVFNLDADNRIGPDFLGKIGAFIAEHSSEKDFAFAYPDRLTFGEYVRKRVGEEFDVEKFKRGNIVDMNCAIRTGAARRFGFDPSFEDGSWEDYDFFLSLARAGHAGAAFRGAALHYRVRRGSITSGADRNVLMRRMVVKHKGFWTGEEAERVCAAYSREAMSRFRLFELLWAKRYGAMIALAVKCLFTRPRVFFSKDGIPKLLGLGRGKCK